MTIRTELRLGQVTDLSTTARAFSDVQLYLNTMGVLGFTLTLGGGLSGGSYDGSADITAAVTSAPKVDHALTIGTHLTGGSYDGSASVTIATDATSSNVINTIVARDGAGAFSAGAITGTSLNVGSALTGTLRTLNVNGIVRVSLTSTDGGYFEGRTTSGTVLAALSLGVSADMAASGEVALYSTGTKKLYLGTNTTTALTIDGTTQVITAANTLNATTLGGTLSTAAQPNVTSVGTLTSLSVTGNVVTGATFTSNVVGGSAFLAAAATTSQVYARIKNTGGDALFGAEISTGGGALTGSTAYATLLLALGARPVQIGSNDTLVASFTAGGTALTGTLAVTGATTSGGLLSDQLTARIGDLALGTHTGGAASIVTFTDATSKGTWAQQQTFSNGIVVGAGNAVLNASNTLKIGSTGSTPKIGTATLAAGTVTITNSSVNSTDRIFVTRVSVGGTVGTALAYTIINGTSFTITSNNPLDTSVVIWWIIQDA